MGDKDGFNRPFAALKGLAGGLPAQPSPAEEPAQPKEPSGPAQLTTKIVLRREKKGRGGKTVTRISGLPIERLDELCQRMKKGLGCGAKVEGEELLLHGSLAERAAQWLRDEGASQVVVGN